MGRDIDKVYKHILKYGWHAISQYTYIDHTGRRTVGIELAFREKMLVARRCYLQSILEVQDE